MSGLINFDNLAHKNIAIFGGSFNPIHLGHIKTADYLLHTLDYDYIIFMPAANPVHKDNSALISGTHRLNMLAIAIADTDNFFYSDLEINRGGKTYTYDTVTEILALAPTISKIGIVIGDDLLSGLHLWKNIDQLNDLTEIICLTRLQSPQLTKYNIKFVQNPIITASSTEIRHKILNNIDTSLILNKKVLQYITANNLYHDNINKT